MIFLVFTMVEFRADQKLLINVLPKRLNRQYEYLG